MTPHHHALERGATDDDFANLEEHLGWSLPDDWRYLYRVANGASLLDGNVRFYPLQGAELSLANASAAHRGWNWPIPEQLCLAGDNGAGGVFGLWRPSRSATSCAVVQTGEVFESDCLALAATSLEAFLLARTAYYLLLLEADADALDVLALPEPIRASDPDGETWQAVLAWADPARPNSPDDPFNARLRAADVDALLGIAG